MEYLGNNKQFPKWLDEAIACGVVVPVAKAGLGAGLAIKTLEGTMFCPVGNFVVRGVEGELYSVEPNIFWKTYEKV